jgi:hypothetical protein
MGSACLEALLYSASNYFNINQLQRCLSYDTEWLDFDFSFLGNFYRNGDLLLPKSTLTISKTSR